MNDTNEFHRAALQLILTRICKPPASDELKAEIKSALDDAYTLGYARAMHDNLFKRDAQRPAPSVYPAIDDSPVPPLDKAPSYAPTGCRVCGIGADGKAYGYVCNNDKCPVKVTYYVPYV
jgi:hypothetical protein